MSVIWKYLGVRNAGSKRSTWFAENPLLTRHGVCVCRGSRAAAQILAMRILSAMEKAMEKELFQHLFVAPVHLHTRQSAKPELNGISGRIYSRQNCRGLVELKTVSIRDCFLFFFNQGVLTLRAGFGNDFLLVTWWILIVSLIFSESSFSTSYSSDIQGMEEWKERPESVKL